MSARRKAASPRILVADDDASLRTLARVILEGEGFEVETAPDGGAAIRAVRSSTFDVLIVDLMMPVADGFEVLRALGEDRPRVIVLSAREDAVAVEQALELGIDAYVKKPYSPDDLIDAVRALL